MDRRETGEKIIECAGQLIAEKGFASVTSKEICQAAGVNLAAVNYHFGSRDGLYLAVLENVQQYLIELQQLIDLYESDLTPRQKMEKFIDFLAGNAFRKNEWQISVWIREVINSSLVLEKIFQKEALPKISVIVKIFSEYTGPAVQRDYYPCRAFCRMSPRTAPFPAQGNARPYTDRNHGGKYKTAGSCQFEKFKKGIKDEHGKDDRALPHTLLQHNYRSQRQKR